MRTQNPNRYRQLRVHHCAGDNRGSDDRSRGIRECTPDPLTAPAARRPKRSRQTRRANAARTRTLRRSPRPERSRGIQLAIALVPPKAPPRLSYVALATPHTTYRVTRDNAIKPRAGRFATRSLRKVRRCLAVSSLGEYRLHLDRFQR